MISKKICVEQLKQALSEGFDYVAQVAPPDNFLDELYEINKLLNDDTE